MRTGHLLALGFPSCLKVPSEHVAGAAPPRTVCIFPCNQSGGGLFPWQTAPPAGWRGTHTSPLAVPVPCTAAACFLLDYTSPLGREVGKPGVLWPAELGISLRSSMPSSSSFTVPAQGPGIPQAPTDPPASLTDPAPALVDSVGVLSRDSG